MGTPRYRALVLDRDGVINYDSDHYIRCPDDWQAIEGSAEAIARVNAMGLKVGLVTNQSGIGRGYYTAATLADIHDKMRRHLAAHTAWLDSVRFCPHTPEAQCVCRKPGPAMLLSTLAEFGVQPSEALYVGDKLSDWQCAQNAGCHFAFVATGKITSAQNDLPRGVPIFDDLAHCIETCVI